MSAVLCQATTGDDKLDACPKCATRTPGLWFRDAQVCVSCENKRVVDKVKDQDRTELAHLLASTDAVARIRRLCVITGDGWFDPSYAIAVAGSETGLLQAGIRYLRLCDLIESNQAFPSLFRLVTNGT